MIETPHRLLCTDMRHGAATAPRRPTLIHKHSPGAKHRTKGASDRQRAHRFAASSRISGLCPPSVTPAEVDVTRRAIWATSWLDTSHSQCRPSCTSRARRLPRLRFWTSNRGRQRRALCGADERQQTNQPGRRHDLNGRVAGETRCGRLKAVQTGRAEAHDLGKV